MDGNPKRRKKKKNLGPPALSGDSAGENSEQEETERVMREVEELKRVMREVEELKRVMEERQMREEGEKLKSKMIAEILEPMKEFARLFEKEKPLIEEYLGELKDVAQTLLERDRAEKATMLTGCAVAGAGCAGLVLAPVALGLSSLLAFGGAVVAGAVAELAGIAMSASPGIDEKRLLEILTRSQNEITALGTSADEVCQAILKWKGYFCAEMAVLATFSHVTEATRVLTSLGVNDLIKTRIELYKNQKTERATAIRNWVETGESDLAKLAKAYSHVKVCISLIRDL